MISLRERAGALSERPFRRLWLGRTTSAIGDVMIGVALAFAVFQIGGGAAQLGLVLASLTIGRTAFVLVGGVWADQGTSPHHHPDSLMYPLSSFDRRLVAENGESRDVSLNAGEVRW